MKKILSVLLVGLLCITMTGCSLLIKSPSNSVDLYMKGIKLVGKDKIEEALDDTFDEILENSDELEKEMAEMLADFDYKIVGEEINSSKDKAQVDVEITTYDYGKLIENFFASYITKAFTMAFSGSSQEEIVALAGELLSEEFENTKKEGKTKTVTIDVEVNKTDKGWEIDENANKDIIVDAITGGLQEAIENISSKYGF